MLEHFIRESVQWPPLDIFCLSASVEFRYCALGLRETYTVNLLFRKRLSIHSFECFILLEISLRSHVRITLSFFTSSDFWNSPRSFCGLWSDVFTWCSGPVVVPQTAWERVWKFSCCFWWIKTSIRYSILMSVCITSLTQCNCLCQFRYCNNLFSLFQYRRERILASYSWQKFLLTWQKQVDSPYRALHYYFQCTCLSRCHPQRNVMEMQLVQFRV